MNRKIISRRISDIQNSLSRLNSHVCAMDSLDIQRYPENYETMSTEASHRHTFGKILDSVITVPYPSSILLPPLAALYLR